MKFATIYKRINKHLLTKKGTIARVYEDPLWWLANCPSSRIYPKKWGHGWSKLSDKSQRYIEVLDALGIRYTTGNDAPRGGVEGDYIELTPYGRRQIAEWSKYMRTPKKIMVTG